MICFLLPEQKRGVVVSTLWRISSEVDRISFEFGEIRTINYFLISRKKKHLHNVSFGGEFI